MSGRRGWLGLVALAALVVAAVVLWRLERRTVAGEAEVVSEVPVRVGALTRASLRRLVHTFGVVEPAPAEIGRAAAGARVAPPVIGTVAAVSCVEGQRVSRGAVLVQLDPRVADSRVDRARKAVGFAELASARQRRMAASDATSQRAVQEADQQLAAANGELAAAEAELSLLRVCAPLSGTVVKVNVRPGEAVDPSAVLVEIADLDRLVVSAGVPSAESAQVKPGQRAELSRGEAGGPDGSATIAGSVVFVGSQIDARTDTVPVRVSLPAGSGLLPGGFVDLSIVVAQKRDCLAAPEEALVRDAQGASAIAVVEGGTATLTPVTAGIRDRGLVEVEGQGLREGTPVVVEGAYGLPKETRVKAIGP